MRFVDQCRVKVIAGAGGNGAAAFRREKFVPFGGPSGGDGGRGGDVVLVGDEGMTTLLDFTHARTIEAKRGGHGEGSDCHGRGAEDRTERVPVGTQIRDAETGELLADVTAHGQRVVVAKGGKGGRGNIHFATSIDRAPRRAEKGDPGEARELELTLKIMADVGLLGFPNVGKSTFVAAVSHARPKIADYPFTTLVPTLGVVEIGGGVRSGGTSFVIADIPGLVPGASEGVGLGMRFLQHVERTRVLLHLVSIDPGEGREPLADYKAIRKELKKWSPELAARPEVVALSKADLPDVRDAFPKLEARFAKIGVKLRLVSAATREGLQDLVGVLWNRVRPGAAEVEELPLEKAGAKKGGKAKLATKKVAKKRPPKVQAKSAVTKKRAPRGATPPTKAKEAKATRVTPAKPKGASKKGARKVDAKKIAAKRPMAKRRSAKTALASKAKRRAKRG